jgi:hypothetical protein
MKRECTSILAEIVFKVVTNFSRTGRANQRLPTPQLLAWVVLGERPGRFPYGGGQGLEVAATYQAIWTLFKIHTIGVATQMSPRGISVQRVRMPTTLRQWSPNCHLEKNAKALSMVSGIGPSVIEAPRAIPLYTQVENPTLTGSSFVFWALASLLVKSGQ